LAAKTPFLAGTFFGGKYDFFGGNFEFFARALP
jgi:hypothetical protein